AGEIIDTNSLMLAAQAREAGCEAHCLPIEPDDPARIGAAVSAAVPGCDLLIVVAGSSAGRDDYTARGGAGRGRPAGRGVAARATRSCSGWSTAPRCWARPATRCPPR